MTIQIRPPQQYFHMVLLTIVVSYLWGKSYDNTNQMNLVCRTFAQHSSFLRILQKNDLGSEFYLWRERVGRKTNKPAASMTPTHVKVDCIFITSQEPTQITTQKLSVSWWCSWIREYQELERVHQHQIWDPRLTQHHVHRCLSSYQHTPVNRNRVYKLWKLTTITKARL